MRTCDFSPLRRSTVGFDHLFDLVRGVPEAMKPRRIEIVGYSFDTNSKSLNSGAVNADCAKVA
jgi:hypothetical protein